MIEAGWKIESTWLIAPRRFERLNALPVAGVAGHLIDHEQVRSAVGAEAPLLARALLAAPRLAQVPDEPGQLHDDRMMSQMMDQMGADMRRMNKSADAKWSALTESVKADLADLPGLQGNELSARMKAHAVRVQRLTAMHEGMMEGM